MPLSKANPLEERFEGKGYLGDVLAWLLFSACKSKGNQLSKQLPSWNGFLYSFLNMFSSLSACVRMCADSEPESEGGALASHNPCLARLRGFPAFLVV